MPNLGDINKSLKSIFRLNSDLKSRLLELKNERNKNKRRRSVKNLIASKGNTTKVASSNVNKKANKSAFCPKNKDIIKDLSKLKNSKIKTIIKDLSELENTVKNSKAKK